MLHENDEYAEIEFWQLLHQFPDGLHPLVTIRDFWARKYIRNQVATATTFSLLELYKVRKGSSSSVMKRCSLMRLLEDWAHPS